MPDSFELLIGLFLVLIGLGIGFVTARYLLSRQKWGDKEDLLNEKWKNRVLELDKDYEIRLEKTNAEREKIREENKTDIERLEKEWQVKYVQLTEESRTGIERLEKEWGVKYVQDIEELKSLFKESEKAIKKGSVLSSRRSLVGKFVEKFVPFLSEVSYSPHDMYFLGQPVDYIVFEGLHEDEVEKIVFLEVKTGESKLTKREKSLKDAIERGDVEWEELRIDTSDDQTPDDEIQNENSAIKELYSNIDEKLNDIKEKVPNLDEDDEETEEEESTTIDCPFCHNAVTESIGALILFIRSNKNTINDLKSGETVDIICNHCKNELAQIAYNKETKSLAISVNQTIQNKFGEQFHEAWSLTLGKVVEEIIQGSQDNQLSGEEGRPQG